MCIATLIHLLGSLSACTVEIGATVAVAILLVCLLSVLIMTVTLFLHKRRQLAQKVYLQRYEKDYGFQRVTFLCRNKRTGNDSVNMNLYRKKIMSNASEVHNTCNSGDRGKSEVIECPDYDTITYRPHPTEVDESSPDYEKVKF